MDKAERELRHRRHGGQRKGWQREGKEKGETVRKAEKESFSEGALAAHPRVDSALRSGKTPTGVMGTTEGNVKPFPNASCAFLRGYLRCLLLPAARAESLRLYRTEAYYNYVIDSWHSCAWQLTCAYLTGLRGCVQRIRIQLRIQLAVINTDI